ncbi:MAG TPA: hypothetical protein VFA68_19575 [Terriglobales bacterium]|nr:hypothetical protein [Terriglobales bacterium]
MPRLLTVLMLISIVLSPLWFACAAGPAASSTPNPLVQLLVQKGVLTAEEGSAVLAVPEKAQQERLLVLLRDKGLITADDAAAVSAAPPASAQVARDLVASTTPIAPAAQATPAPAPKPEPPKVVPAVAPLRVMQLEPSKPDGLIPDIKLGSGARIKLYGLVKASVIYDSSSPYGTDMPLPGFINTGTALGTTAFDPGPNGSPEFHAKARFFRFGTNFEWPDVNKNNAITGRFEFDFEGNFTRVLNRNISTIRSSQASIRLAWGRIDHRFTDKTSVFALFGQDWTPFGSSTLPAIYETTGLGLGFGTLYERAPQFRFGIGHKVGGSRNLFFQPEFAVVMPAYGNDPKAIDNQLGYGERQGADSARPEIQARFVTQWQLDKAPGVAPAQLIFSGVQGERTALVRAADVPLCPATTAGCPTNANVFKDLFPTGASISSTRWGYTAELQLPTRWMTLTTKYWRGGDLRWYFVGSLFSNFNDTGVFDAGSPKVDGFSNDQASTVVFGLRNGAAAFAPQRPVRAQGAFINLGFPLGRIFHAEPAGRNAGWVLYLYYAYDEAFASDVRHIGNTRQKNDLAAVTLNYKLNNLVSFTFEESYYRTRAVGDPNGVLPFPTYRGFPARQWQDIRTELGPTFTF